MNVELLPEVADVIAKANKVIEQGGRVFFKFTCQHCGARQTFPDENAFYLTGQCEECKGITDCNSIPARPGFMTVFSNDKARMDAVLEKVKGDGK